MRAEKLGELVSITGGGTPDRSNESFWGGDVPWVTVKDFKSMKISGAKEYITAAGLASSASNLIPAGSIIVPTRMALGKAAINTTPVAINQDLKALRIKDPSVIDRDFLFRFLLSKSAYLESQGKGATVKGITLDVLREIYVPLPPKTEQQRIAAILDKADSLRSKRQEAIRLASKLVRSKFSEMFGEPHINIKGLPKTSLGDLVKLKSGNFLPSHEMAGTGGVFVYGGNGVNGEHDTAMFDEVKLVIGRVGAYCGAVHLTKPHSWITDNALYVSEISPLVRLEYLAFALTQANLNQYSSQSGQPLVSASRLYPVMLVLPPLSLQEAFLEVLDRTTRVQASQTNSLEALEEMSRSLAAELFA